MKNEYDARRRNLGVEPPSKPKIWRRRAFFVGGVVLSIILIVAGAVLWWHLTRVTTVRAVVRASIVSLSTDVDARMQKLFVKPGDKVKAGDVVARLEDKALQAALASAQSEKIIKESLFAQAKASAELTQASVNAEIALAKARVEIAGARVTLAKAALDLRKTKLPVEIRRAQAQRDEAQARLNFLQKGLRQEAIDAAKARLDTAKARELLGQLQVRLTEELVKREVESLLALEVRKTELVAQKNEARETELRLAQLEQGAMPEEIEAVHQALQAREADLELVRANAKEPEALAAELAMREAELVEAKAQLKRAEDQKFQIVLATEKVKAAEAELSKAKADLEGREAVLKGTSIISPVAGTVIRTFDHEGEVCRKAVPTILVADDSAGRWIEGFVTEYDASRVRAGQPAEVEVVLGSGDYIDVVVDAIGLHTSAISRENTSGFFANGQENDGLVWIKLRPVKEMNDLLPGMSAAAVIRVR